VAENSIEFELTADERKALQAIRKVTKAVDQLGDTSEKSGKKSSQVFNVFLGNLAAGAALQGINALASGARSLFNTFITDGVRAAQVQEDAVNSLNAALQRSGEFSQETSRDLQEFASSIQQVTTVGDEAVLQTLALAQAFGFSAEQSKVAAQAAIELSEAAGISLEEATRRVGRTISGSIEDVSKFAPEIKNLTREQLAAGEAANLLADALSGTAAARLRTFSGSVTSASANFSDLQEVTGQVVTQNPALIGAIRAAGAIFVQLQSVVKDNSDTIRDFVGNIAGGAITSAITAVSESIIFLSQVFTSFNNVADAVVRAFSDSVAFLVEGAAKLVEAAAATKEFFGVSAEGARDTAANLRAFSNELRNVSSIAAQEQEKRNKDQEQFAERTREISDQLRKTADEQIQAAKDITVAETQESQNRLNAKQQELTAVQLLEAERKAAQQEEKELQKIEKQVEDDENFLFLEERLGREEAIRVTARAQQLENEKRHNEALKVLSDARAKAEKESIFAVTAFENQTQKQRINNLKGTFGTISTLQQSSSSTLFGIGKAAALAQHALNVPEAISKALSSAPPPFNFALAALVGTAMAVQGARIASARPPAFQDGGIVPGSSFSGDQVLARVNSGELILNRAQQASVAAQLEANEGLVGELSALRRDIVNQPVTIEVDGKELAIAVRNAIDDGVALV